MCLFDVLVVVVVVVLVSCLSVGYCCFVVSVGEAERVEQQDDSIEQLDCCWAEKKKFTSLVSEKILYLEEAS